MTQLGQKGDDKMQLIDVTAELKDIEFAPANELEEILQNVKTILTTTKYSVPLDRNFGINADLLDSPTNYAKAKLTAEIIETVQKFEPRVRVKKVLYDINMDGQVIPKARVVIINE